MSARLMIDWTRCDGHGLCASLLADVELDDAGFPLIGRDGADGRITDLRRAAAVCPALALRLEQG